MREQGGSTLFSSGIERKKVGLKASARDESNDGRRRLNGGYLSYLGGKSIANLPGNRLKGESSILNDKLDEREHGSPEEKPKDALDSEFHKRIKGGDECLLPQWGHGKRSRCSRLEHSKHAIEESAIRVEKGTGGTQANGIPKLRGQGALGPGTPVVREAAAGATRRLLGVVANGVVPNSNASSPSDVARQGGGEALTASAGNLDHGELMRNLEGSSEVALLTTSGNGGATAPPASSEAAVSAAVAANKRVDLDSLEWPRILISLSRKEKEEDFLILKGTKLPQRPKKRPKVVEKALQYCTPGNWLSDLTRSRYDVREKKSVKKKPRGLKAMESMDSDSE